MSERRTSFIDYKCPKADHDIANLRNSFRKRDNTVSEARPVGEGQTVKLNIPDCMKTLVPGETAIRITVKLHNFDSLTYMDGGVQRLFNRLIIKDGHGVELESIEHYNRVYQTLFDVHVPEHLKYTSFQQEGVYKYEVPSMLVGPRASWNGLSAGTDWTSNIQPNPDGTYISSVNKFDKVAKDNLQPSQLTDFSKYLAWRPLFNRTNDVANAPSNTSQDSYWSVSVSDTGSAETSSYTSVVEDVFDPRTTGVPGRRGIKLYGDPLNFPTLTGIIEGGEGEEDDVNVPTVMYHGHHVYTPWYYHIGKKYYETPGPSPGLDKGPGHVSNEITFVFHPAASGILSSTKHIPLWITKGLEIELEMDRPSSYLRDARSDFPSTQSNFNTLSENNKPFIEITRAEVIWTGVDLTEKMITSINKQYEHQGLHFCYPSFTCEEREEFTGDLSQDITGKIEFKNRFAMLNRVYSNASISKNAGTLNEWSVDTFNTVNHNPTVRSWEYNRIYRPDWGSDQNIGVVDHYYQTKKSIGSLHNYRSDDFIFGNTQVICNDGKKQTCYYIDEFETEPSGFLTGVDTNNEKMVYRYRPTKDVGVNESFYFTWHYYNLAVYRRGEPVIVKS